MSRVITEMVEITDEMLKPSKRLIDADALMVSLKIPNTGCEGCESADPNYGNCMRDFAEACMAIKEAPTIEERSLLEQIRWERDTAIQQLKDLGYGLGEKPRRGRWVRIYSRPNVYADLCWHCSYCDYKTNDSWANTWNFCPCCGAQMKKRI